MSAIAQVVPDTRGRYGPYGGRYVPETLVAPLEELERAYAAACADPAFRAELDDLLQNFAGRPTPLQFASRLTEHLGGARIYLKREDLLHTGAHKINNCLGQGLLAVRMGKKRVIAETGAGQHGVATATVAARLGLDMHGLHGHRGHGAPAAQRFSHALARRGSDRRRFRQPHAEGRDQRSHARLGHQRAHVPLPARFRARRASLSANRARFSQSDRRRGARTDSAEPKAACPIICSPASAAARMQSACSTRFSAMRP